MESTGSRKALTITASVSALIALAVPVCTLFKEGSYLYYMFAAPELRKEWAEIAAVALIAALIGFCIKDIRKKAAVAAVFAAVFCYLHQNLLPMGITAVYMLFILSAGGFVEGTALVIVTECLLSLMGFGKAKHLRIVIAAAALILFSLRTARREWQPRAMSFLKEKRSMSVLQNIVFMTVLVVFLIQAGRMNVALDFDSLWYGLRSDRVLAPGGGIYEDTKLLGMVYTYSKGFEVLTLPLSGLSSFSYVIFMNVWIFILGLYETYRLTLHFAKERIALAAVLITACVPSVVNMTVTAKPDIITWTLQLIMLERFFAYVKGEKGSSSAGIVSAYILSLTMKPTAVVFSTALFGMMLISLIVRKNRKKNGAVEAESEKETSGTGKEKAAGTKKAEKDTALGGERNKRKVFELIISALALAGIWGRTLYLTGLPFTSVFTGILEKAGFVLKYPFNGSLLPENWQDRPAAVVLLDRAARLLLSPDNEDMDHVIIAWGGSIFFVLIVLIIVSLVIKAAENRRGRTDDGERRMLLRTSALVFIPFAATNLVSLAMLYQVDGNYFITLCTVIIVTAAASVAGFSSKSLKTVLALTAPVLIFQLALMTATNWASVLGFSEIKLNKGRYNHVAEYREYLGRTAGDEVWVLLESDPDVRVVAFGTHPYCLQYPAVMQSVSDIFEPWGNGDIAEDPDMFREYLYRSGTDYVLGEKIYLNSKIWSFRKGIFDALIESGCLQYVCGNDDKLYKVVRTD